jgi:poly-gamma-glutamate synthesis protein (capsule biosynthesis protein)
VGERVRRARRAGDVVVASIHWGGNWGYAVSREQREFAHALIEAAGVDVVFGHSSHHAKGIEVYRDRPILYGCGDFLNDYEGIGGYEEFRGDLALAYLVSVDPADGTLAGLVVSAFTMRRFRLAYASPGDTAWGRWERGGDGGKEERNRRS